jgi:hypothetical protein
MQQTARNKEMPSNCKTNREFIWRGTLPT